MTSTLASQKGSKIEEVIENFPQTKSTAVKECEKSSNPQQKQPKTPLPNLVVSKVPLPNHPPRTPDVGGCLLQPGGVHLTPGTDRETVVRCPTSRGSSCSPGARVTSSLPIVQVSDIPLTLTWDNFRGESNFFPVKNLDLHSWTIAKGKFYQSQEVNCQ